MFEITKKHIVLLKIVNSRHKLWLLRAGNFNIFLQFWSFWGPFSYKKCVVCLTIPQSYFNIGLVFLKYEKRSEKTTFKKPSVFFSFCSIFCQFQSGVADKSGVAYKKSMSPRGIFRTLPNIYDGVFHENSQWLQVVNFFVKHSILHV